MNEVLGLVAAKVNGIYRVDVKNVRWRVAKPLNTMPTQGGIKKSKGLPMVSGSFDEVIPKQPFDWKNLENFSIQLYDYPTRSLLILAVEDCDWESIDGNADFAGAQAGKAIAWKGVLLPVF